MLKLRKILGLILVIGLIGALKPIVFNDNSSVVRFLAHQDEITTHQDEAVADYMNQQLFAEESPTPSPAVRSPEVDEEAQQRKLETWRKVDHIVGIALLVGVLLIFTPIGNSRWMLLPLLATTAWLILQALADQQLGGKLFSELSLFAHATRWGLPLILAWLIWSPNRQEDEIPSQQNATPIWTRIARICCATTFAAHGWEAFQANPPFVDLIAGTANLINWQISPAAIETTLKVIGCVDFVVALGLLFKLHPSILLFMSVWGFATALSRPISMGHETWFLFAERAANFGLPLVLYLFLKGRFNSSQADKPKPIHEPIRS